jgi:DNA processing protein
MSRWPPEAYAAALADLPGAGPAGLGRLLSSVGGDPAAAWSEVLGGRHERPAARSGRSGAVSSPAWAQVARRYDMAAALTRILSAGIQVTWLGDADYPGVLRADPSPPAILFWRGHLVTALGRPAVALVGTRRATAAGRELAFELGRDLADAGVCVVSGLALGIDGAAHRGALAGGERGSTIGVAASGVDRVYPRRHADLWETVASVGAVLSETPPGRAADGWRFPARNRIIAGLVSMVVVVESHAAGGSLITADAAIQRGIEVRAVPGPVRSPASAGTNQLLFDGPGPVRDARDILEGLSLAGVTLGSRAGPATPAAPKSSARAVKPGRGRPIDSKPASAPFTGSGLVPSVAPVDLERTDPVERAVLAAVGWSPTSLNRVVDRSGRSLPEVAAALDALVEARVVVAEGDWWQRRR